MTHIIFPSLLTLLLSLIISVAGTPCASAVTISYETHVKYLPQGEYHTDGYHTPDSNEWNKLFLKFIIPAGCTLHTGNIDVGTHRGNAIKYAPEMSHQTFGPGSYLRVLGPDDRYFERPGTAAEGVVRFQDDQTTLECESAASAGALSQLFQFEVHQNNHSAGYYAYVHGITLGDRIGMSCNIEVPETISLSSAQGEMRLLTDRSQNCPLPVKINGTDITDTVMHIPMKNQEGKQEKIYYHRSQNLLKWDTRGWEAGQYMGSMTVKLMTP